VGVADVHAHDQKLVSIVKMATVLEECIAEEQRCVVRFLQTKGLGAKDIHKEMFPAHSGKCLSLKAVPPWWQTFR
jgi:hypothetical protein